MLTVILGDDLYVRPGRQALIYEGDYSPVTDLTLVSKGLGIVASLQILRELLRSAESSVTAANVVWVNPRSEDFVLYDHLESLFFKYPTKIDVWCVIEDDFMIPTSKQIREAIPKFHLGTMSVICGPHDFQGQMMEFFQTKGYPKSSIVNM